MIGSSPAIGLHVELIESASDLAALEDAWERLQADARATSVFASFSWQALWWQLYGPGRALKLLVAEADGGVVGILPLYIETAVVMHFPVRELRLVGSGSDTYPDDLGPVLARGREVEVARALAEEVLELQGWDVLRFTDLQSDGPFPTAMAAALRARPIEHQTGRSQRIVYLDLPETWEGYLGSLSRDRRYRVRKIRKDLNAAGSARFYRWDDPATLDEGVDRLVALHRRRWEQAGERHSFASTAYVDFHRAVMHACLRRDQLRLYALDLDGKTVAMYYFYRFRDRVYLMQGGFDPDRAALKPGQVLLGYIIEQAISEGFKVLDFLQGEHRYKDELASGERETVFVTAFGVSLGAWAFRARYHVLPAVKAHVKTLLDRLRLGRSPHTGSTKI
jgi:CelD/BcsL family acetyltransferase involved in cellulose biosynthesis